MKATMCMILLAAMCAIGLGAAPEQPGAYPAPAYPRYLVKPAGDRLIQAARIAVRQPYGRSPLGKMQGGQRVHVFLEYQQDMEVFEAIRRAWAERGVEAISLGGWELAGVPKSAYEKRVKENLIYGKDAWKEMGVFEPQYQPFFSPAVRKQFGEPLTFFVTVKNLAGYLDRHPAIQHFYQGVGGRGFVQAAAGKRNEHKFMGNWIFETKLDLLGKSAEFPGDVWSLVDDQIVKPIPHVSEGTFTDPQGTDLHWALTPEQTRIWAARTGDPNHLTLYPPAVHATWTKGIIRATANHTGHFPVMGVHINSHGKVVKVEGGGKTGELFRMLVEHPKMKNAKFPSAPETGYWYLSQDGFGTNPKYVRDVEVLTRGSQNIANLSERNRAGVQHFSFTHPGETAIEGGGSAGPQNDVRDVEYAKANGLPLAHTSHMHVYFSTIRWRLGDTGEWITVSDKGFLKAFDDPEVRALASKYGDPNLIFRYEWIPEIPGVNAPGDHDRDYGADSWKWIMSEWARIQNGTYRHYVDDYQTGMK